MTFMRDALPLPRIGALYLVIAIGLCMLAWPSILSLPAGAWLLPGAVRGLLAAVALRAHVGMRRPYRVLPLLLFELLWKMFWIFALGPPRWLGERLDTGSAEPIDALLMVLILLPVVVPWPCLLARRRA